MTTLAPIAVQLYSLREELEKDFAGVVTRLAELGYLGVEPFGAPDNFAEAAALFRQLDLVVPSTHAPLPLGDDQNKVLEIADAYGLKRLICPAVADRLTAFSTVDNIKATCDMLNEANAVAVEHGLAFGYHNHWWEFQMVEGRSAFDIMLEYLDPAVFLQLDTYWIQVAGVDAVALIQNLGARVPLLHIKDGPLGQDEPMLAFGEGQMDIPAIVQAGAGNTEWLVVELDRCATDMFTAIKKSYHYMVNQGLARGRDA